MVFSAKLNLLSDRLNEQRIGNFGSMIFIIVPVFNRKEFTKNCLKSLGRQTFKDYKIIVVDDGSTDGTSEMITNEFPDVHIIKGDGNLWWAGATNKGIEYVLETEKCSDADYILTLNNDLEVPNTYLEIFTHIAQKNKRSILGSVSVDIRNQERINFSGISWNKFTGRYHSKAKDYSSSYRELIHQGELLDSDLLPGRGTLIPVKVFNEIGLYDSDSFPQYAADEDFSLRARRRGWNLIIPTNTFVMSHIGETGTDVENVRFSCKYYKHLFFSIKSPLNLKIRYRWAMKNTPLKFFYFLLECIKILLSVFFKSFKGFLFRSGNRKPGRNNFRVVQ
jgi:GT2 family glycosyltransferase